MTTKMKTEKTEKTETPETNNTKAVFAPLGKYAVIAVIMVSIIVTTAIMLDKQLQTVETQIAAIESEVANSHIAVVEEISIIEETAAGDTAAATTETTEEVVAEVSSQAVAAVEMPAVETSTVEATPAENVQPADIQIAKQEATAATESAQTAHAAPLKNTQAKSTAQARQAQLAQQYQVRINTYKQEQKQHMSEMFARIKVLETQQLDRYKANQDSQVTRLRGQITQQQQMIDALVLRNKELFELRTSNMQRNQANRKQVLNRI